MLIILSAGASLWFSLLFGCGSSIGSLERNDSLKIRLEECNLNQGHVSIRVSTSAIVWATPCRTVLRIIHEVPLARSWAAV